MTAMISWLYVPGDRPDRFDKAVASGAAAVIIDLEDAVAPGSKDLARANAATYLSQRRNTGPEIHVRINDLSSDRGIEDLHALAGLSGLDAIRVPKVEAASDLEAVEPALAEQPLPVYALIESAKGLAEMSSICRHPLVAGIALGEQDLIAELGITDPAATDQLRLLAVLAAAAAGLSPVPMSVYPNVRDEPGLVASCRHGRSLGMFGRTAIHPRQIPLISAAFRPTSEEISWAESVHEATQQPQNASSGAYALPNGQFVDAPIITRAARILDLAARIDDAPGIA